MKRFVMFILVLALAIGSVMALDSMATVGLDYGAMVYSKDPNMEPFNFTGMQAGLYTYGNEFSSSGFYTQISFQTMVTEIPSELFTSSLMSVLAGYNHRFALGSIVDVLVGGGGSYQMIVFEGSDDALSNSSVGIGASAEVSFLISPKMTINAGASAHIGIYDLSGKEFIEDIPVTVRPYIAAGFRF